jgi:hypothetical protein
VAWVWPPMGELRDHEAICGPAKQTTHAGKWTTGIDRITGAKTLTSESPCYGTNGIGHSLNSLSSCLQNCLERSWHILTFVQPFWPNRSGDTIIVKKLITIFLDPIPQWLQPTIGDLEVTVRHLSLNAEKSLGAFARASRQVGWNNGAVGLPKKP